ncbi:alpha/beta-hydrolase [Ophiobolus disseminans]|uniref:Alpha/beta-hydrolase n=1 Tax=Ophiobolus disseminans TaxID=1469910 RepID=A0A6A7AA32_9PLEO|nr:alpha/beta-hydrolase [Ophiobolus disseminans]
MQSMQFDIAAARNAQCDADVEWATRHPLESVGYTSRFLTTKARDGSDLSIKLSHPTSLRLNTRALEGPLPVLFAAHGGGYISGSHTSEEAWMLWPLYDAFDLLIVSVEYRLAPEHQFPAWIEDAWDVLQLVRLGDDAIFSGLEFTVDLEKIFLAGSSAGAGICATLSQICRDRDIALAGVILNVPMLCDYRLAPVSGSPSSYERCCEALPHTRALLWVWEMLAPSSNISADARMSPLLGRCLSLPRHAIFVAGQDPLHDEGRAYARKLEETGVSVDMRFYSEMPHHFAQYWELDATKTFWADLQGIMRGWLAI